MELLNNFKTKEVKARAKTLAFILTTLLLVLLSYYFFVKFTSIRIPCMFHIITKLDCPGCGITRMLTQFLSFNFKAGIKFNYFLAFTMPIIIFIILYMCYAYLLNKKYSKWFNIISTTYCISLIVWGIVRNIISI